MKNAQSAVEAAIIISIMTLMLIVFLLVIFEKNIEVNEQRQQRLIDDIAFIVKAEAGMAVKAEDGYNRTFNLPEELENWAYSIQLIDSSVLINHTEIILSLENPNAPYENAVILPKNVLGEICRGKNTMTKQEGLVVISCNRPAVPAP